MISGCRRIYDATYEARTTFKLHRKKTAIYILKSINTIQRNRSVGTFG